MSRIRLPSLKVWVAPLVAALLLASGTPSLAATERYEYDSAGRLVRWIDQQGNVTDYIYDRSGNILEVRRVGTPEATSITSITPNNIRRGESLTVSLTGTGLTGATIASLDPELDISELRTSSNAVSLRLGVSLTAVLGARTLTLRTATGQATFAVMVTPALPKIVDAFDPIVLRPDNIPQTIRLELSSADIVAHAINLVIDNTAIATISPSSVVFAPGETSKDVVVRGVALGVARLARTSPTLASSSTGVYVTAPFAGSTSGFARDISVLRLSLAAPNPPGTTAAPDVGVLRLVPRAANPPGTMVAPDVGVTRFVPSSAAAPGVFAAPDVGVQRLEGGNSASSGILAAPDVGVDR